MAEDSVLLALMLYSIPKLRSTHRNLDLTEMDFLPYGKMLLIKEMELPYKDGAGLESRLCHSQVTWAARPISLSLSFLICKRYMSANLMSWGRNRY